MLQRQIEEERKQKTLQRDFLRQDQESTLKLRERQKHSERDLALASAEEYKRLTAENARKEVEKERKYRQFFADRDQQMCERLKWHADYVTSPESTRAKRLQEWVRKNEERYIQRQKDLEAQMKDWNNQVLIFVLA